MKVMMLICTVMLACSSMAKTNEIFTTKVVTNTPVVFRPFQPDRIIPRKPLSSIDGLPRLTMETILTEDQTAALWAVMRSSFVMPSCASTMHIERVSMIMQTNNTSKLVAGFVADVAPTNSLAFKQKMKLPKPIMK